MYLGNYFHHTVTIIAKKPICKSIWQSNLIFLDTAKNQKVSKKALRVAKNRCHKVHIQHALRGDSLVKVGATHLDKPWFRSLFPHFIAKWFGANCLISLSPNFLIYKVKWIIPLNFQAVSWGDSIPQLSPHEIAWKLNEIIDVMHGCFF